MSRLTAFKLMWVVYGTILGWWIVTVGMVPFGWPRLVLVVMAGGGVFLSRGWARAGWMSFFTGATLNTLVIGINGGYMPIAPWCSPEWDIVVPPYQYGGTLWWFGDVLGPCAVTVISLGDVLIAAGLPLVVVWWVQSGRRARRRAAAAQTTGS